MNIFSNIGITELVVILLLALLVVGPERLPEMGRKLAKMLRDVRKMYENLTSELGPELMSIQETTRELRESVDAVRSIPKDTVQSLAKAADLEDTIADLKGVTSSLDEVGRTVSGVGKMVKDPVGAAVSTARKSLLPSESPAPGEADKSPQPELAAQQRAAAVESIAAATAKVRESLEPVVETPVAEDSEAQTLEIETPVAEDSEAQTLEIETEIEGRGDE